MQPILQSGWDKKFRAQILTSDSIFRCLVSCDDMPKWSDPMVITVALFTQRINTVEQRKPVLEKIQEAVWVRMNMTQDWKLSYRKVYPMRRRYRNSAFCGNSRKLLITSPPTLRNEEYHNQIKPVLNLLRLLGLLPLKLSSNGESVLGMLLTSFLIVVILMGWWCLWW